MIHSQTTRSPRHRVYNHVVWLWGVASAVALLWPHRISGPLHGVPLDSLADVITMGVAFPILWCSHGRFLATRTARVLIVALLAWKGFSTVALVQDGWCVRVVPGRPYAKDAAGAPHSWDVRADWRSSDPACSAIMTRPYRELHEFPVWFFNLPPPDDNWPSADDLPPAAHVGMTISGFVHAGRGGVLRIDKGEDVTAAIHTDGHEIAAAEVSLEPGLHGIVIDSSMTGDRWRLVPTLDGADLWSRGTTTVRRPSSIDLALRPWGRWITATLVGVLVLAWAASAVRAVGNMAVLAWAVGASLVIGTLAWKGDLGWLQWAIAGLAASALLSVPRRLQNAGGALLCVGIPWLVFVVIRSAPLAGRFTLYVWGNDYWSFQRFAYRIVMLGYWLEGGSATFWFQPLYRWIAGVLHLVFGDSSIGESIWDGACMLVGSLAAFRLTCMFAGFEWALVAAAMNLAVFVLSGAGRWMGAGLGEISSAGFIYLAVCFAITSRGSLGAAVAAGVLATLGFYTRLNNLLMACGVAAFAVPLQVTARDLVVPSRWLGRTAWRSAVCTIGIISIGVVLFAWRTWHFTGVFSVFYGTQRDVLATWQPGMRWTEAAGRMLGSVMMVLTVNDPARFDPCALPVLAGAGVAVLSVLGVPRLRTLPLAHVLFFFASLAGALFARGSAYSGRFSVHVIPITCTLTTCAAAALTARTRPIRFSRRSARDGEETAATPVWIETGN